jgi:thiol-disulfide isomerase/thioredoxin
VLSFSSNKINNIMNKYTYSLLGLVVLAGIIWLIVTPGKPGKLDDFAKCINDTGTVTFYGAFWCPHCQAQKARFGKSAQYLPYVECSTPNGQGQLQVCKNIGVGTYPTWVFATSTVMASTTTITGEMELADLAEKTSCVLPE